MRKINYPTLLKKTSDGKIFSVTFVKRSTGEIREMVCRTKVKKHLKGGSLGYDPKAKKLLMVFDMQKEGYRSIPFEGIQKIQIGGEVFEAEKS